MKSDYPQLVEIFEEGVKSRNIYVDYCPRITKSECPKEEVARGLVADMKLQERLKEEEINIEENISNDLAVQWNQMFVNKYNYLFKEQIEVDTNEIINIVSHIEQNMDVCNFFMKEMYKKYYKRRIGERNEH